MTWFFEPLPLFCADLVVMDPPTEFALRSENGVNKSGQGHYAVMTDQEILDMPVGLLVGANSWIFLWSNGPKLEFGFACLKRWGFIYVTELAWRKVSKNGKPMMGPGYVARSKHESVLIGKIGRPRYRKAIDSEFDGVRRQHSRKPEEFYQMIDNRFALPWMRKLDCFARQSRAGWITFGNQRTKFDAAPGVAA
ncbi:MAG: hypothetical protein KGZ68_01020 [Dechloromonas sp.]|nr:hypothetical protein [Dechloromonas sp.]